MREILIVGNWKMNPKNSKEAAKLFGEIVKNKPLTKNVTVAVCVPYMYLPVLSKMSHKGINLGAQDVFYEKQGAFTGEISAGMLKDFGVKYILIGHSERRVLGETSEMIAKKIVATLSLGMTPIVCVGERERTGNHEYVKVVKEQVMGALSLVPKTQISKIIFAYEPVWALSTTANRKDATPADAREMMLFIRKTISDVSTPAIATKVCVIYGGSANEKDAREFLCENGIDGLLPGRASLSAKSFHSMIQIANKI